MRLSNGFVLCCLIFLTINCFAQKQLNTWYFGNRVGLNFNQNLPQVLTNGKLKSVEGCASISDHNGDLLFYTNGEEIVNRNHQTMQNGNGILGDISSTNNVVIIPMLGNDSIFYVFTIGSGGQSLNGFRYSMVNMKLNAGLGAVTVKNELISSDCFEKMAAVRHCNKKDVWITVRGWNTDEYRTYLLTPQGFIDNPIISHTGFVVGGFTNNVIGTLKFSSDARKLVAVHSFENDCVELMNFDNSTGIITNALRFKPNTVPPITTGVYGAEFSPNCNLLYISANNSDTDPSTLYQFDIRVHDSIAITSSRRTIANNSPWFGTGLQIGPDKKIYYSMWNDTSISVIETPDSIGPACNFVYNKILLSKTIVTPAQYGLPTIIASDINPNYMPYDFFRVGSDCSLLTVNFKMSHTFGIDSVRWNFGDGTGSNQLNPVHMYSQNGVYPVRLVFYSMGCVPVIDTIIHEIQLTAGSVLLRNDTAACSVKNYYIESLVPGTSYLWNTGATTPGIKISNFGSYWLESKINGCMVSDTFRFDSVAAYQVYAGVDTVVCTDKPIILNAQLTGVNYLWSTGETSKTIEVNQPGLFWVKVSGGTLCPDTDTVQVNWGECDLFIPTAFTPNADHVNDLFGPVSGIAAQKYRFRIFNRYGMIVFETTDMFSKWNGTIAGKPAATGSYTWMIHYTNKFNVEQFEKGTVMLIR